MPDPIHEHLEQHGYRVERYNLRSAKAGETFYRTTLNGKLVESRLARSEQDGWNQAIEHYRINKE